jgi:peptide/nickel transport system substrate-binding protein
MWQAPTALNPHFAVGLKDAEAARIFYEPLAGYAPDGTLVPVLAEAIPTLDNGGLAPDGLSVTWRLKRGVTWHDGAPFTADDVVFNWEFAADPATASAVAGPYREVARVEAVDAHTVRYRFRAPAPAWYLVMCGLTRELLPRHVFGPHAGARARQAAANLQPVGTGPYRIVEFRPGDVIRAEATPRYHGSDRPFFDELEVKGGGDAASAARAVLQTGEADVAWLLQVEDDLLRRLELGGRGRVVQAWGNAVDHLQVNFSDPWTEVDGERSSARAPHPILSDPAVRAALALLVDRDTIARQLYGRQGQPTARFLNAPPRFRSAAPAGAFSVERASRLLDAAGWARGADGVRERTGRRLRLVLQAAGSPLLGKVQAVVRQACAQAGIELELKSVAPTVFASADPGNADTYRRFAADLQLMSWFGVVDPQRFMEQFTSWEIASQANRWSRSNVTRWRSDEYDRLWRQAAAELDPDRRAALFHRMNDLVVGEAVVIPIVWRSVLHAVSTRLEGLEPNGWDSLFASLARWRRVG